MDSLQLRSRGDSELAAKILDDPQVKSAIDALERDREKSPIMMRRRLLATALRVTESMMPDLHAEVRTCRERLGIDIPLEVYVFPSPTFNAACIKPEDGRLFILIASSLLEAFPAGEQRFVIGHELAHHRFGHHDIPVSALLGGQNRPRPDLALRLFAWSRYAEISADRGGAHCADQADDVARALFRLASGLTIPLESIRISEFAEQADELEAVPADPARRAPIADWFSTHPFSPLRLKAVRLYFESELAKAGGFPVATLEARVQELMAVMEPSYLEEKSETAELARRLLFSGMIVIAAATDGISDEERQVFERFFGEASFSDRFNVDDIRGSLKERIGQAREKLSFARRIQVVRDLCVMARASGRVSEAERVELDAIAAELDVQSELIDETFYCNTEVD